MINHASEGTLTNMGKKLKQNSEDIYDIYAT